MSFQPKKTAGHLAQQITDRLSSPDAGGLQFTLTAGGLPPHTFVVSAFTLNEAFSTPFTLAVSLASADPAIDFAAVLDNRATLTILRAGKVERAVTGMVACFEQGNTGKHQTGYKMTVRPDMWRTTLRQNSRIFQQQDIQTIITTLLKENGVRDVAFSLRNPHPEREFCVQYRETDFEFLQRLTAEEGLFYFFEFSNNKNTLVFADDAGSVVKGPVLPYHPGDAEQAQQLCITRLTRQAQVRPAVVELKDYTFKNPAWAAEFRHQMREQDLQHTGYEHFDFPGGFKDGQHGADFTRYRL
ncbi:type VI secretion system tip protein TssI/VgrG, partial [Photorhabdus sp. P32]|uniref:type VI secretion system tip protein TssI/VgrG n=1 Tax=Photorhabdus sp. P32 TaxID=3117549 RepID=UPI00311B229C